MFTRKDAPTETVCADAYSALAPYTHPTKVQQFHESTRTSIGHLQMFLRPDLIAELSDGVQRAESARDACTAGTDAFLKTLKPFKRHGDTITRVALEKFKRH